MNLLTHLVYSSSSKYHKMTSSRFFLLFKGGKSRPKWLQRPQSYKSNARRKRKL